MQMMAGGQTELSGKSWNKFASNDTRSLRKMLACALKTTGEPFLQLVLCQPAKMTARWPDSVTQENSNVTTIE
jgi:hypothetical protein